MSMLTLAFSCLTTSNLPWLMDLTFPVPKQYCSLQHRILLPSPVTSTAGRCFVLALPLHSLWSYVSTLLQQRAGHLPTRAAPLSVPRLPASSPPHTNPDGAAPVQRQGHQQNTAECRKRPTLTQMDNWFPTKCQRQLSGREFSSSGASMIGYQMPRNKVQFIPHTLYRN